jgi:putative CocE/NonD family hydrolase
MEASRIFAIYLPSIARPAGRRLRWFRMRLLFPLLIALGATAPAAEPAFNITAHYTKYEYRIPMRDGVRLFTAVYVPKDASQKWPILMARTPYGVDPYGPGKYPNHLGPPKFAEDGFIFVYQDVRGRFMSEGEFVEMRPEKDHPDGPKDVDESTDTYDTIEWLLKNIPNHNGKVGLFGISYPGFYASAGLINAHPALVAVSPQAPIADLYMGDDAYHNGAFFLIANFSFYTFFNKQHNPELPRREPEFKYGTKDGYKFYLEMGPLVNSNEKYLHYQNPYWTDIIKHPNYDEFWQTRNILPHLKNVKPAVLIVGGWFDAEDLAGTLKTYRAIGNQSPETNEKIVMGPWVHGGWFRSPGDKLGDIRFGSDTAEFFREEIELPFFRHYLKGAADPQLPKAYVFETGKNVWRREQQWPPQNALAKRFYLAAHGQLAAEAPKEASAFDEYTSDPNHPVPFYNKPTLEMTREYMDADQRFVQQRQDVVTYATEPLEQDITVAGPVSPSLYVSTTGSDSDFVVKLIDVYPQNAPAGLGGYEQLVRGEPFRGKFRNSFEHPEAFKPGEVQHIQFAMPDIYHCFQKEHRIMVQIQSSWFPLVDRNPQTFTDIPNAGPAQFVKAMERVYRSKEAASYIQMSVEP